jgi:hypothetical protein
MTCSPLAFDLKPLFRVSSAVSVVISQVIVRLVEEDASINHGDVEIAPGEVGLCQVLLSVSAIQPTN